MATSFNIVAISKLLKLTERRVQQLAKDGIIFNRSLESDTCYQVGMDLVQHWQTPSFPNNIETLPRRSCERSHARVVNDPTRELYVCGHLIFGI